MLARFSRLIPMYQGIGTPRRRRAALRLPAACGAEVLFFMPREFVQLRAGSVPAVDGQLVAGSRETVCQVEGHRSGNAGALVTP